MDISKNNCSYFDAKVSVTMGTTKDNTATLKNKSRPNMCVYSVTLHGHMNDDVRLCLCSQDTVMVL